jgi:phosphopantothenoylcysteine decarboxylase/phosphopantothenate--cysteine ligase
VPTYESLDSVRRLTNLSTGRLGTELAGRLSALGHEVSLLIGEQATYPGERRASRVEVFTTTEDLGARLRALSDRRVDFVFHAAAVSDFKFGKVWRRGAGGGLEEVKSGKISTREGPLLAELAPTPKLITQLRGWFGQARLVGWKFEVEGNRADAMRAGERQVRDCRTDACVVNGPAYGEGFGLLKAEGEAEHCGSREELFERLARLLDSVRDLRGPAD